MDERQLATLLQAAAVDEGSDQVWLEFREGSPVPLAASFGQQRARLVGLTAYADEGEVMVCYHYALKLGGRERVCTVKFRTHNRLLVSIAAHYPGAGWQEEATAERFNIRFTEAEIGGLLA